MESIESLQAEYLKVAGIITNLRKEGIPEPVIRSLWQYQASLLNRMAVLAGQA